MARREHGRVAQSRRSVAEVLANPVAFGTFRAATRALESYDGFTLR